MNYYERHIGDYLKDTAHLSLLEHGVYCRLLDVYYTKEVGIEDAMVARLIGAKSREERAAMAVVLGEFFVLQGGVWTQSRCDREIERYQDKQRKAKASAEARWSHTERNAKAMRTHSEGNAPRHQTPDTIEPKGSREASAKPPRATRKCPESFAVSDALLDWAQRETPGVPLSAETAKFRDHTFKVSVSDWDGAWRNWMRKALEFAPAGKAAAPAKTTYTRDKEAQAQGWMGSLARPKHDLNTIDMEGTDAARLTFDA